MAPYLPGRAETLANDIQSIDTLEKLRCLLPDVGMDGIYGMTFGTSCFKTPS